MFPAFFTNYIMAMELFFENLIKIEEAASSGLNLMKKEKGNPNLQFFLYLQKELDCDVVFTKGENDPDCPIMTDFINIPEVRDIYDNCRGDNTMLIVKGQNKNDSSKTGYVKLYVNQNRSQEILDKFPDAKKSGDKITFLWNNKEFTVQESGAEEKISKRTAEEGKVVANYLDDKVLPSTKSQLNELFRDLDIVYKEDKTIPNAIKSFITYKKETSIEGVNNLVFEYSGKYSGTDNITYELDTDTIEMLKDALLKIAADLGENYPDIVEKVFSGQLYGSGLRPEYIEGSAIVNLPKIKADILMPYKVEFYCSQHFPLVDFVAVSGGKIYPYSVKDENGGNKSTCCRFLKAANVNNLFSMFEEFRKAGFTEINNTLEKICANIDWGYRNVKLKGNKELEIGKEYPMGDTVNKQSDWWRNCDPDTVGGDVYNLGIYIASYLVKYSNRKDDNFSLKNMPGRIFNHFRLGINGERILKHNGKFILNQCEKVAVNIINQNRDVLDAIQESIESFGVDTLGTPVIKIKPTAGGFKEIEQSSKMRLKSLSSRGGGGKLGIIKNADGSVQVTEITTQGQGQFFGYEFIEK